MKIRILLLALVLIPIAASGEITNAVIEGVKLPLYRVDLKVPGSDPVGGVTVDNVITVEDGKLPTIPPMTIDQTNVEVNELSLSITSANLEIKAYANVGGTYYFTQPGGTVGQSANSDSTTWTNYGYSTVPYGDPADSQGHVVLQSYFPSHQLIEPGDEVTVTASMNLDYNAFFYDGSGALSGPFGYTNVGSVGTKSFMVAKLDFVLGFNTNLAVEVYRVCDSADTAPLDADPIDTTQVAVFAMFFASDGSLYDGVIKYTTRVSSASRTWERVIPNPSAGKLAFGLSSGYYAPDGLYPAFEYASQPFVRTTVGGTGTFSIDGGNYTYKRVK